MVVIEDAAHAWAQKGEWNQSWDTSRYDYVFVSSVKHITTGEGGIITTDNKEYYEKLKIFRTHGITKKICLKILDLGIMKPASLGIIIALLIYNAPLEEVN